MDCSWGPVTLDTKKSCWVLGPATLEKVNVSRTMLVSHLCLARVRRKTEPPSPAPEKTNQPRENHSRYRPLYAVRCSLSLT